MVHGVLASIMVRKFGVSLDEDVAAKVEEPLEYEDSRSERINDLVRIGLYVETLLAQYDLDWHDEPREARDIVRGALRERFEE
jgi:hypothetical protein